LLLGFSDYTTDGYDYGFDSKNTDASNNDLHLSLEGESMNIQAYGPITEEKVVPLNFSSSGDNEFEIRISDKENIDDTQDIYLLDNLTGTYFSLKDYAAYSFTSDQGIFNDRFEIVFQNEQQSLSVETAMIPENHVYFKNQTNTLFVKKLSSDVKNLSLINMHGQVILEMTNVSRARLESGLQFNNITTGAYVVCMRTEANEVLSKKIIVE
ncbi:T9SS type A sorting domain-containing protein, partial [Algibacter sp.]|uniref:T9SS type A sorting domain-containing protein n=1 Tax=Algibacter sp. TaxID=1872428 RepID=UPI003C72767A